MGQKIKSSVKKKTMDIIFLERRLKKLVLSEEYEKVSIIKRWIDELSVNSK
jgi:protein-arginine kinase activator protein McsA